MCGIAGIFSYASDAPASRDELLRMRDSMKTRGPDGAGEWFSSDRRVALGHRRLSIIDLSDAGAQPMIDARTDNVITFNGEIYNYRALRDELITAGYEFRTGSDTEVLLAMYAAYGINMFPRLRGMYAFALWDAERNELLLARDPYGIKPLYIADDGRTIRFASQVRALVASGAVSTRFDAAGAAGFLLRGTIPEPFTMYEQVRHVPAGSFVRVGRHVEEAVPHFSIAATYAQAAERGVPERDRLDLLRSAVKSSVAHHTVADVTVGAFLSAGIDSSSIVGLAANSGERLHTLTLRFDEYRGRDNDETPEAALVAQHYGVPHAAHDVTYEEFAQELPRVLAAMDQPTVDGINTYFVSRAAAADGLKVALSGAGGDELFGGYSSFRRIPKWVRMTRVASRVPFLPDAFMKLNLAAARRSRHVNPKVSEILRHASSYAGAYFVKRGLFVPSELAAIMGAERAHEGLRRLDPVQLLGRALEPDPGSSFARVAVLESAGYLRNQLLRDMDWASMAHSLEVRVPLVDAHLLQELAPLLVGAQPPDKRALANTPEPPLPSSLQARKKTGFTVPMKEWMQREMGDRVEFGKRSWAKKLYTDFFSEKYGHW